MRRISSEQAASRREAPNLPDVVAARKRNRPIENRWIGQPITKPEPDIVMFARAQGAVRIGPVRKREELLPALTDAMSSVLRGETVVVDVRAAPGYTPSTVAALTRDGKEA
jgi:hypothetical protein